MFGENNMKLMDLRTVRSLENLELQLKVEDEWESGIETLLNWGQ